MSSVTMFRALVRINHNGSSQVLETAVAAEHWAAAKWLLEVQYGVGSVINVWT